MPVYKQGVEDAIKSSLLTTIGDILAASAVSTPARIAAPASGQVFTGQGVGVLPAWAAAATGAVTRAGGNTVEATTTSVTDVNLLSTTSLSIGASVPVISYAVVRKTTGAAASAGAGVTVNATNVRTTDNWWSSATNSAQAGVWKIAFMSAQTSYDTGGFMGNAAPLAGAQFLSFQGSATPIATITSLILVAKVGDAAITMGADEMHVFVYAVS